MIQTSYLTRELLTLDKVYTYTIDSLGLVDTGNPPIGLADSGTFFSIIHFLLATRTTCIIHGPPGTGKTYTI